MTLDEYIEVLTELRKAHGGSLPVIKYDDGGDRQEADIPYATMALQEPGKPGMYRATAIMVSW